MYFQHSDEIWSDYPELVAGLLFAEGITPDAAVAPRAAKYTSIASLRLAEDTESALPEVQAWRRTFSRMRLKPTQYRCASESLLRRYRKEGSLPQLHPMVDIANAVSLAFALPVAVFDTGKISECIVVRYADGDESYLAFSGELEQPDRGEVVFVDSARRVHARRWANRQSGYSAVEAVTSAVLVVIEGMHAGATTDVAEATAVLGGELEAIWSARAKTAVLAQFEPRFDF
ncbi:MAG TPA: phenylalanine--tRNA ligase beta subunit-related protein [Acidimicrobiales bacterium]|nr:phenylalanine--tRNA ligase beta subunit-related protein [Acidimicrobiales bacterium]